MWAAQMVVVMAVCLVETMDSLMAVQMVVVMVEQTVDLMVAQMADLKAL